MNPVRLFSSATFTLTLWAGLASVLSAATSRSADYVLSGGIVTLNGFPAESVVYRNLGRLLMPRGQTAREHRSTSGEESASLDVVSTGFRLLPKFDQSTKGGIAGAEHRLVRADGSTSMVPALAISMVGGVIQFSSAEEGEEPDNVRPLLEWEGLVPFEGAPTDEFIFSVFYQDEDGDRPKYVKLHLDDVVYLMQAEGKKADYLEGVVYSVKVDGLSWGPHEFSFSASDGTHEVKTFWEEGPFVEGDDPDFNHPPALWDNDVEPWSAVLGEALTFRIVYQDEDGDVPEYVRVVVDGTAYDMSSNSKSKKANPLKGLQYEARVDGLSWGPHDHYFVASDGKDVTKTRQEHGPFVEGEDPDWNYPPELHDAEVDPSGGTPSDEFVFRVFYQDQEGGDPEYVRVEIDGVAYDMTPEGKGADYADGVLFEYKADGLAWGPCRHRFFASDGNTVVATRLEAGPYVEGEDPDWNYAPELHDASVEPWDGSPADEFVFQVIYLDEEGDSPEYVHLLLDGKAHEMVVQGKGSATDGLTYTVTVTGLFWGPHSHSFAASDGTNVSVTDLVQAPLVQGRDPSWNSPPEVEGSGVEPFEGTPSETFTFTVFYFDEEGDTPEFVKLVLDGKDYPMEQAGDGSAEDGLDFEVVVEGLLWGPHYYQFVASDGSSTTTTPLEEGPYVQGEDPDWDYAPELYDEGPEPWEGAPGDEFTFRVYLYDADNDAPDYVKLFLDGKEYAMKQDVKGDFEDDEGVLYAVTVKDRLDWGPHTYYFVASSGDHVVSTAPASGPMIGYGEDPDWNEPAEIEVLEIFPFEGTPETEFTFHVSYWDEEGDAPKKVEIIIDGQAHSMKLEDGDDFAEGVVYSAAVSGLDWGPHTYKAVAEVGGEVLESSLQVGPYVDGEPEDWNNPPELEPMDVEPWDGTPGETFTFTVLYFDMDGNVPEYVTLVLDGKDHDMAPLGRAEDFKEGVEYVVEVDGLTWGPHSHYFVTSDGADVVSTRPSESPILEGDDPAWNEPPHLEDYEVDPDPGLPSDEFTFRVTYLDDEGVAPEFVKLVLDGTDYPMKLEGKVRSYADGAVFSTTVKELTWGPHVSQFVASDGVHITITDPQPMPYVEGDDPDWNEAPNLEEDGVEPWDGTPAAEFVFRVIYTDDENDAPAYVRLLLDGQPIEMNLVGKAGKYYQGVTYEASVTNLAWGPHRYQFVASDGTTEVTTRLSQGPMVEGDNPDWNYAPDLWDGQVDPWEGPPDATYTYSVFYQDEEGDAPDYVQLRLGKKTYPMKASGKKLHYAKGVLFSTQVKAPGNGPHSFVFEASDGSNQTDTDLLEGPWIEGEPNEPLDDYPPELDRARLKPTYGSPDTTFVFTIRYRDMENTPPASINLEVDNRSYPMTQAPVKKATTHVKGVVYEATVTNLGWGPHRYRFTASDGAYSISTPWQQGPIVGGEDPDWNAPPEFDDFWVEPSDGTPFDEYVFTVIYSDEDDDPPAQILLFLDGKKHSLKPANSKNKEYFRGVDYTTTVTGLSWGPHSYYFVASDGNSPISSGRIQGPYVQGDDPDWNNPPEIWDYEITPEDGSPADTFDFRVTYADADDEAPKSVQLVLDGKSYKMARANSKADDFVNGVDYVTSVSSLAWGPHSFRFLVSDGTTEVWSELNPGPYVMGGSPDWNEAPDFYDYNVEPNDGTPADEFTFWAEYADADGDEPTSVKLRLDGKDYSMVKENAKDNDYADGVRYFFKVKGLAWGPHRFSFSASDGTSTSSTPPQVGPFVQGDDPDFNFPPDLEGEVEPWDGLPSDQFEFRATYWDEEGDAPRFVKLTLDGKQYGMKPKDSKAKLGTEDFQDGVVYVARVDGLKWGPHSHYFSTSDGNHSTQTDRIGGPFIYGEDPDFDYAPEIVDYDVDPYSGPPSTTFQFMAEYADPEGKAPESIQLYVDGKAHDMTVSPDEEDFDYEDGVAYVASVTGLDWGPHSFYIEVSDGTTATRSLVEMGPYVQGEDPNWNRPPDLEGGEVDPWEAEPGEPLKFRVFYSDEEGHPPAYVRAFLDGEPISLKPEKPVTNHAKRVAYVATIENTLAWGPHRFWFSASDGVNAVVTQPEQGPLLSGKDAAWDAPPQLESDGVEPWDGPPGTDHTFFVVYEDEANQAPTSVKLHLDDKTYDMAPLDRKATLYAKGVTYTAKVGGLAWGPHKHRFSASDGTHEVFTQWEQGPNVQGDDPSWNQPPDLRNAQVKPQDGGPDTEFLFKVRYNDDDNEPPSTIQLFLDDKAYDMVQTKASDAYYKGVYYQVAVTGLAWGPHSYAFTASDGVHTTTTLPESGPSIGGEDEGRNYQPEITDWEVEPWDGGLDTEFVFTAEYEDYDGDAPTYVRLLLDGKSYEMEPVGKNPDYLRGALYTVSVKGLAWGPHRYQIIASDGQLTDQTHPEAGPYVQGSDPGRNRAPTLRGLEFDPPAGSPEDAFTFSVLYYDTEGDKPEYVNLVLGDYVFPMTLESIAKSKEPGSVYSIQLTGLPPGSHSYAFEASDGRNLGETRWLRGPKIKGQKPKITSRLASQRIPVGGRLTLSVSAEGTKPMSYRWLCDGEEIEGATDSTLTLTDVHTDDIGIYRAEVTNIVGTTRSSAAKVLIVEPPEITVDPEIQTLVAGESFELSVEATGTPRLFYQWYRDGQAIPKALKGTLKLKAYRSVEGVYTVKVSNDAGSATSAPAQVEILHKPVFAEVPTALSVVAGEDATFTAKAVAKDVFGTDVSYHWLKGKTPISDATSETLTLTSVSAADLGTYAVRATNKIDTSVSKPVRLTVLFPPTIVSPPKDYVAKPGGKAQFVIKAKGTKVLTYQWYKNGSPIKGANRNRLMLNPVKAQDAGAYKVVVTNPVGRAESRVVTLTLASTTVRTTQSPDLSTPFAKWTDLEDLSGSAASSDADGDDDGVSNLLEYAFNGNPYSSDSYILPRTEAVTDADGSKFLAVIWRESNEATGLAYQVQVSSDLQSWSEVNLEPYAVSRTENGGHVDVTLYLPVDLIEKLFVRVTVTEH